MTNKIKQTFNQIILNRKHLGVEFNGKEFLNTDIGLNKVASILDGGTDIILLNNNFNNDKIFLDTAIKIKQLCAMFDALLLIQNRADIAFLAEADGLYLDKNSLSIHQAKEIVGEKTIIGMSINSTIEAISAIKNGADYICFEQIFSTPTTPAMNSAGLEYAKWVSENFYIPAFVRGNINYNNIKLLSKSQINKIIVGNIVTDSDSPNLATEKFVELLKSNS